MNRVTYINITTSKFCGITIHMKNVKMKQITNWHLGYNTEYLNIASKIAKRESYKISTSLEERANGALSG